MKDNVIVPCDELQLILESLKEEKKLIEKRNQKEKLILDLKEPKIILPAKPVKIRTVKDLLINFLHGKNDFQVIHLQSVYNTESRKYWERKIFLSQKQLSWLHSMILREVGDKPTCAWIFTICDNLLVDVENHRWGISVNVRTFTDIPK